MWALVIIEVNPPLDARFCLRNGLTGMQVDTLVFQGALQPLDEDIVGEGALPIH